MQYNIIIEQMYIWWSEVVVRSSMLLVVVNNFSEKIFLEGIFLLALLMVKTTFRLTTQKNDGTKKSEKSCFYLHLFGQAKIFARIGLNHLRYILLWMLKA